MSSFKNQWIGAFSVVFGLGLVACGGQPAELNETASAVDKGAGTVECPACSVSVQSAVLQVELTTGCIENGGWTFQSVSLTSGEESVFAQEDQDVSCNETQFVDLSEDIPDHWGTQTVQVILVNGSDKLVTTAFLVQD